MKSFRLASFAPLFAPLFAALPAQDQDARRRPVAAHAAPTAAVEITAAPGGSPLAPADEVRLGYAWSADGVAFELGGPGKFFGGVIVSMRSELRQSFLGLPPLLGDHAVLGLGFAVATLRLDVAADRIPMGIKLYAQGVLLGDGGLQATAVVQFGRSAPDAVARR